MNRFRVSRSFLLSLFVLLVAASSIQAYVLLSPAPHLGRGAQLSRRQPRPGLDQRRRSRPQRAPATPSPPRPPGTARPPSASPVINATVASVSGWRLGDGIPMLNFRDPVGACTRQLPRRHLHRLLPQRANGTYRINDADIVTNTAYDWTSAGEASCSSEMCIEGVMVHEVGHGLGLGHTSVAGATMYPSVSSATTARPRPRPTTRRGSTTCTR